MTSPKNLYENIPESSGVYLMRGEKNSILYVGKAVNLLRRVSSYFTRPHDSRIDSMVSKIKRVDFFVTPSALQALILEAQLIKKYEPPFNIREKDGKSFLHIAITDEEFPRVLLARGKDISSGKLSFRSDFGPFTSASSVREAMKIVRKIFPWNTHEVGIIKKANDDVKNGKRPKPCFNFQIGLCPGTCAGIVDKKTYMKSVKQLELLLSGKMGVLFKNLEKEMKLAARNEKFEDAGRIKKKIFALSHIQDVALISEDGVKKVTDRRIEGYDISNIGGKDAVGVMVVFDDGRLSPVDYRKFKIKTIKGPDDTGMIREVISRRFNHKEWHFPELILVDGGTGQVNAVRMTLKKLEIKIPVVGIAKGADRKNNEFVGIVPKWADKNTLIRLRDESHRFAIAYHKELRDNNFISKKIK